MVKRYFIYGDNLSHGGIGILFEESEDGDWVKRENYDSLMDDFKQLIIILSMETGKTEEEIIEILDIRHYYG